MTNTMGRALAYSDHFDGEGTYRSLIIVTGEIASTEIDLADAEDRLRQAKSLFDDRKTSIELNTAEAAFTEDAKVSQAAVDRKIKAAVATDDDLKTYAASIIEIQREVGRIAACLSGQKRAHDTMYSRVRYLAGYHEFLAAVKSANTLSEERIANSPF